MICQECTAELPVGKRKFCSIKCRAKCTSRNYRLRHPDKVKARNFYDNSNIANRMFIRVRSRARAAGVPFNIEVSDIVVPKVCPVLGIELATTPGMGSGYHHDSASLDRIKPHLGYIKGNVRVISCRANLLKNDASLEELELVIEDLRRLKGD